MKIESLAAHAANARVSGASAGSSPHRAVQQEAMGQGGPGKAGVFPASREDDNKISPEEILDKIKEISQDGLYSVRFEKNEDIGELVVKLVDRNTEEVIRQIPPESILGMKANLREYSGNILNQVS